eukprot:scaffold21222_cov69-Cyclotella_meneghiniana.AAC.3
MANTLVQRLTSSAQCGDYANRWPSTSTPFIKYCECALFNGQNMCIPKRTWHMSVQRKNRMVGS